MVLTIETSDIDASTPASAERLAQRIAARVETACERPLLRDLKAMREVEVCVASAQDVTVTAPAA